MSSQIIISKMQQSKELLKDLYNQKYNITDKNGKPFDIPLDGSLGLLALGYQGLFAWRNKKNQNKLKTEK